MRDASVKQCGWLLASLILSRKLINVKSTHVRPNLITLHLIMIARNARHFGDARVLEAGLLAHYEYWFM